VSDSSSKSTTAISERALTGAKPWCCEEGCIFGVEGYEKIYIECVAGEVKEHVGLFEVHIFPY
jgi:hypothetical protein